MDVDDRLRIVQWATGNIGTRSLRSVMEHPGMSLAGVRVYSGDKVGRDAGELCGLEPVGVAATGDVDDILALDADCVLYMPRACDFDERRLGHLRGSFGPSLQVVADALSLPLDSVEVRGEVATAPRTLEIAAGTVPAGTIAAQRITVSGVRDGEELLRFRANWYCSKELDPAWELQDTGWRVVVEGDTPLDVNIQIPISLDRMAEVAPGLTAHRAVNAVAAVCAAAPGIRTSVELPQLVARLG